MSDIMEYNIMRELNLKEVEQVSAGNPAAALLWSILVGANEGLNDFGRGLGSGLYDALNS